MNKEKFSFLFKAWAIVITTYLLGHWLLNTLARERAVERTLAIAWDGQIPFLPIFVYFYITAYLIFTLGLWLICQKQTKKDNERTTKAALFIILVSFFLYLILPAKAPWVEVEGGALDVQILNFLHSIQQPYNTLPSLHAAFMTLVNYLLWRQQKSLGAAFLPLAITIILSTLFTKQHVIVDIPAGILLSLLSIWLFFRK